MWETYRTPAIRRASRGDEEDPSFPNDKKDKDGRERGRRRKSFSVVYLCCLMAIVCFLKMIGYVQQSLERGWLGNKWPKRAEMMTECLADMYKKEDGSLLSFLFLSPSFTDNYRWLSCNVTTRWWRPHEKRRCWASNSSHVEQSKPSASQWRKGPHRMETSLGRAHYL